MLKVTRLGVQPSPSIWRYTSCAKLTSLDLMQTFMSAEYVCTLHATPRDRISAASSRARSSCCPEPQTLIAVV